jgi:hypothetical protein
MFVVSYKFLVSKFISDSNFFFSSFLSITLKVYLNKFDSVWIEFFKAIFLIYISSGYKPIIFNKIKKLRLKQLLIFSLKLTKNFDILNFINIVHFLILPNLDIESNVFFLQNLNNNFFFFYLTDVFLWASFSFFFSSYSFNITDIRHCILFTLKTYDSIFYMFFVFRRLGLPLNPING